MNRLTLKTTRAKLEIPPNIVEELLALHAAFDAESGHLVCHTSPLKVIVVESRSRIVPLVQIGNCTYATVGEENVKALVEGSEGSATLVVRSTDIFEIGSFKIVNREVLEILGSFSVYSMDVYVAVLDGSPAGLITLKGEGATLAILATSCEEERRKEPLHV
ncbi:MAG: hypothetical protein QXN05_03960 [Acidilobaceae archaeon]